MIKFVDMFSGIGGFREGLTRAGGFECVGHCEIDKYANRSYNALFDTKGEWFIQPLPLIAVKLQSSFCFNTSESMSTL